MFWYELNLWCTLKAIKYFAVFLLKRYKSPEKAQEYAQSLGKIERLLIPFKYSGLHLHRETGA